MKVSQRKFAELEGVSRQRVNQWVAQNIISLDLNGKVDVEKAREELRRNRDENKRIDWATSYLTARNDGHRPPAPFSGTLRDWVIMGLAVFYPFFIEKMVPMHLELFKMLHVRERDAKGLAVCFAFAVNELTNEFIQKDVFKNFILDAAGEDIDELSDHLFRRKHRKHIRPGRLKLEHPPVISGLLKELGTSWPFKGKKKK